VVLSGGAEIQIAHLPLGFQSVASSGPEIAPESPFPVPNGPREIRPLVMVMRECERQCLQVALDEAKGDRVLAAKQLGLSRRALTERLRLHGL
jgi:DNA-binding NtrC family response regulator